MTFKDNIFTRYSLYLLLVGICIYLVNTILNNVSQDVKIILESTSVTLHTILYMVISAVAIYLITLYKKFKITIFVLLWVIISITFNELDSCITVLFFIINIYLTYLFLKNKYDKQDYVILVAIAYISQLVFVSYLIWIISHFKINYGSIYFIILIIQTIILSKINNLGLKDIVANIDSIKLNTSYSNIFILIIFTIFTSIAYNIIFDSDSLIKHYFIPRYIYLNGFFPYSLDEPVAFDISGIIPTYTYTFLYLIGGEGVFGLINIINFFLGIFIIKSIIEKYLGQIYGLISVIIIIFTPMMMLEFSYLFIDSFSFLFSSFILYLFVDYIYNKRDNYIVLIFLFGNLSILSKLQMVYILVPIYLLILTLDFRNIIKHIKIFLLVLLITSIIIIIPMFYNYIKTGNPLFPWYNGFFKSEYFWYESFKDLRWNYQLNLNILNDITFSTNKFIESTKNTYLFGFHYLAILPLIIFVFMENNSKKFFTLALIFIFSILIMQYSTGIYMRYYLIILPLGTFLLVFIVKSVYDSFKNIYIKYLFTLYLIFIFILNILFFMQGSILNNIYRLDEKPNLFLYNDAAESFYKTVNKIVEPDSNLLSIIYLREKALYNYKLYSYNNYFDMNIRVLNNVSSEREANDILEKYDIKYFVIREDINEDFNNIYLRNIINNSEEIFRLKSEKGHVFILKKYIRKGENHEK